VSETLQSLASVAKAFVGAGIAFVGVLVAVLNVPHGVLNAQAYLAATLAALGSFGGVWLAPNKGAIKSSVMTTLTASPVSAFVSTLVKAPTPADGVRIHDVSNESTPAEPGSAQ
jgi:hypothetical protein